LVRAVKALNPSFRRDAGHRVPLERSERFSLGLALELAPVNGDGDGDGDGDGESLPDGCARPRPVLELAQPRSGPTPKRVASNATAVSVTDPDAKLRHKPGHRKHLVYPGQVAVDPKAR